jgi:hypothetical protein
MCQKCFIVCILFANTHGYSGTSDVITYKVQHHSTNPRMKLLDISKCELISAGKKWTHTVPPCSRDMLPLLERQEMYCSWFQPIDKSVEHQFPALKIDVHYYAMSLRMQKAVFRHIRLHPGFINVESTPSGRHKLRIPQSLLLEKQRTACRFTVMPVYCAFVHSSIARSLRVCGTCIFTLTLNVARISILIRCDVRRTLQGVNDELRQVVRRVNSSRRCRSTVHRGKPCEPWTRSA